MMMDESVSTPPLVEEALRDRRKLRNLIAGLYDIDMERRFRTAKALGEIASVRPEYIRQIWRRIFYAFDDTMSCWGVAEGLGEIARNMPELRGKILLLLKRFEGDEASCQGFIWAICRIGQADRSRIEDFIPELMRFLGSGDICMFGQSIWAAGELGIKDASGLIENCLGDERETWIYENDTVEKKTIGKIAEEAIGKLNKLDN